MTRVFDDIDYSVNVTTRIIINDVNSPPNITNLPATIVRARGNPGSYDCEMTDSDIPPNNSFTWSLPNHDCSFTPVIESDTGLVSWTCGSLLEICHATVRVTDNGSPPLFDEDTLTIGCGEMTWTGASPSGAVGGIRPPVARIANNYPADWGQVTLNFNGAITSCSATVTCGGENIPGSFSINGSDCIFTTDAGYWPSEKNCTISNVQTDPGCLNCLGLTDSFHTSKRPVECSPMGGGCGGFIDVGSGGYGTGNQVVVKVIKKEDFSALTSLGDGIYTYLLFEQDYNLSPSSVLRQEFFDGNNDGLIEITPSKSGPAKITVGYRGYQGNCWKDKPPASGMTHRDCFQLTTIMDMDSRNITIPLDYTGSENANLPRLYITGDIPITSFQTMVYNNPPLSSTSYNGFPNPLRIGVVSLAYRNQSLADVNINTIFQPDPQERTLVICYGSMITGGNQTLKIKSALPFNVLIPDLIRANWTGYCSAGYTQGPGTTYRYYTNEKNITRTFMVLGGVADCQLFNVDKAGLNTSIAHPSSATARGGLNFAFFPIFLKAIGTYTATIPASYNHYQSLNLGSTPFEIDFRDPGFATDKYDGGHPSGSGRSVLATLPRVLATDQVRMAMGTTPCRWPGSACATYPTLPYGDPNRWEQANWSTGGTATKNGVAMVLGGRIPGASASDPGGIIVSQLHMTNRIDSEQFTFFKRAHNASGQPRYPSYTNDNPWSGTTTKTGVVSEWLTGIPSTRTDPGGQVLWTQVEDAISIAMRRPQVESYIEGGLATAIEMPSAITKSTIINDLTPVRSVKATTEWLPFGNVTNPTHDGYYIPNQTGLKPCVMTVNIPINRDGMIWRGSAGYRNGVVSAGSDQIKKKAGGMQYFTISNPTLNVDATRRPDYFVFYMADGRGRIDPRTDDKIKRGWLNYRQSYNRFWKFYGNIGGKSGAATYEFTIPYIEVGSRTLGTVTSAVPRPWQGYGNQVTNSTVLEWDLIDLIIGTKVAAGGVTAVFDYQNQNFNWFNIGAEFNSSERHQFIWQL